MTVLRGFLIVAASAFLCALLGTALGWTLAVLAPAYYRGVFSGGGRPGFDPVQVGIGLGLTQGLLAGVVVGCVVVLAVAWFNARRQVIIRELPPYPDFAPTQPGLGSSQAIRPAGG